MKQYSGTPMTNKSPSGNMLYGDKTEQEKKNEDKKYKDKSLNEAKSKQ